MQARQSLDADRSAAGLAGADGGAPAPSDLAMKPVAHESQRAAPPVGSLPPPDTKRWVIRRKAAVVAAVRSGGITLEDACRLYQLSEEEFLSWVRAFEIYGLAGLRTTRLQQYRGTARARQAARKRQSPPTPFP
jgi:hypothetical protein